MKNDQTNSAFLEEHDIVSPFFASNDSDKDGDWSEEDFAGSDEAVSENSSDAEDDDEMDIDDDLDDGSDI